MTIDTREKDEAESVAEAVSERKVGHRTVFWKK